MVAQQRRQLPLEPQHSSSRQLGRPRIRSRRVKWSSRQLQGLLTLADLLEVSSTKRSAAAAVLLAALLSEPLAHGAVH